jgi:hypothetical protein
MTTRDVLDFQVNGSFNLLAERVEAATDDEWTRRAFPGTSLVGFILWHGVRIMDWTVHTSVRGVPEVAERAHWKGRLEQHAAYGAGIGDEEADRVAQTVDRETLRAYLDEVRASVMEWLRGITDADLDRVPDVKEHQAVNPRYLDPPVWAEVSSLAGLPTWQILARPSMSHIRLHVGQIDTLLQAMRVAS